MEATNTASQALNSTSIWDFCNPRKNMSILNFELDPYDVNMEKNNLHADLESDNEQVRVEAQQDITQKLADIKFSLNSLGEQETAGILNDTEYKSCVAKIEFFLNEVLAKPEISNKSFGYANSSEYENLLTECREITNPSQQL